MVAVRYWEGGNEEDVMVQLSRVLRCGWMEWVRHVHRGAYRPYGL